MTARYDRLGPMALPRREQSFPGWHVLGDLEGRERDPELARRARLRFLSLRLLKRLSQFGFEGVPAESFERQIDAVREELGQLSARDPERMMLARQLNEVRDRDPDLTIASALTFAEWSRIAGYYSAAEEFARTAHDLASAAKRPAGSSAAARCLSRIARSVHAIANAEQHARTACELATQADDHVAWVLSVAELAASQRAADAQADATASVDGALKRAREWGEARSIGLALSGTAENDLATGDLAAAVDHGYAALRLLQERTDRLTVLGLLARAFEQLRLHKAAIRCLEIRQRHAPDAADRARAAVDLAETAAGAGDNERSRLARAAAIKDLPAVPGRVRAALLIGLGRASFRAGAPDAAREHLREAIAIARREYADDELAGAEDLLGALEQQVTAALHEPATRPTPSALRIAAEMERAPDALALMS